MYDKLGSWPSQLLRDSSDSIFQGFNKKGLSIKGKQVINSNISYRPPILSLDLSYFKGFNFNSLDAISEGFKTKIWNQGISIKFLFVVKY